jgi:hypothetical protein
LRDYSLADSASIFWRDATGAPSGFYHDCAPAETKDLFITHFDALFAHEDNFTMISLTDAGGPAIGVMLAPESIAHFWTGNVYKYLCAPLGHRYALDVRIDVGGKGQALMLLWNKEDKPFRTADAEKLVPIQQLMCKAAEQANDRIEWRSSRRSNAHFITDPSGAQLLAIDREATGLLTASHLLRQNVGMTSPLGAAPVFAQQLAGMLASDGTATLPIPIAGGRLLAHASWTTLLGESASTDGKALYIALEHQAALPVQAIEFLITLDLTQLQKEIALFAMVGNSRADCEAHFGVSSEALKKHLRAIYVATGASRWDELAGRIPF